MPEPPAAPAARIRGLTKRYGEATALDGVDLELAPGELRGLLGPNGAGKTTLLRTLFGLVGADAGTIELLGRELPHGRRRPLGGVGGFVEDPAFYAYLSARANLELLGELDGDDDGADPAEPAIDDVLARVGLRERAGDRVGHFSTGMRQRLGIAAALMRSPRLLLLDEPTSGLDPAGIRAVSALLRELCAAGVAVLLSSHLIGELETLCDSYTILREGRVVWDGTAEMLEAGAPGTVHLVSTDDDARALALAAGHDGLLATRADGQPGLRVGARGGALDGFVRAIVAEGLTLRRLELLISPLQSTFFSLTGPPGDDAGPQAWLDARSRAQDETVGIR